MSDAVMDIYRKMLSDRFSVSSIIRREDGSFKVALNPPNYRWCIRTYVLWPKECADRPGVKIKEEYTWGL